MTLNMMAWRQSAKNSQNAKKHDIARMALHVINDRCINENQYRLGVPKPVYGSEPVATFDTSVVLILVEDCREERYF